MKRLLLLFVPLLVLFSATTAQGQCNFDPVIAVDPPDSDFVFCPGTTVVLSTESYDSYQWYYNFTDSNTGGTLIEGAIDQQFALDVSFWGFAYFYVEATKDGCTEASPTQLIDSWVFLNPVIQSDGQSDFCEGDSTEILAPSPGIFKYRWYRDGEQIPGAFQQNYWVKESGTYIVEVAYQECPDLWLSSGIGPSFFFTELIEPVVTLSGDTLTADSGLQWQWLLNGQPVTGATGPVWVALESGEYSLRYTDVNGCQGVTPPVTVVISSVGELPAGLVRVFPNPAQEVIFVETKAPIAQILLFDQLGRLVRRGEEGRVSLNGLPGGMYAMQVMLADGRQFRKVVLKTAE